MPLNLRRMCRDRAQHISRIRFRSADDTDAHRMITGLLAEQYWMVAAERRVRSEVIQNRRICHGSRTRMLFYLYPHKRMTASEQTYSENFELCLWRGGVIEIFFKNPVREQTSCRCSLWANVTDKPCLELTRFIVPCQPRIVRCRFTLRYSTAWNSNKVGLLCN